LFNVGSSAPIPLLEFVGELEDALRKRARKRYLPLQPGDVVSTYADVEDLCRFTGYRPNTSLREGVQKFAAWFLDYTRQDRAAATEPELALAR
jgi:UDP-glucuronate 4-epimerase